MTKTTNTAMKVLIVILFVSSFLLLGGCGNPGDVNADGTPDKLVIAVYTGGDNPGGLKSGLVLIKNYLQKKLGIAVEFNFGTDYNAVIEAIRAHKAHVAYLSPFSYILASQRHDITPIVTLGENDKPSMYHSIIFTNYKTGLNSMADVKARAKSLTLCFADPASTSGHLIPRAYLVINGLNPDSAFKQTIFAGTHAASLFSVATGRVDVGCSTLEYGIQKLERSGALKKGLLKVLWTSDPIVSSPLVVRNDLNKALVGKIQAAYLNMKADAPKAFSTFVKLTHPDPEKFSYIKVDDSLYNGLRKIARGIKDLTVLK